MKTVKVCLLTVIIFFLYTFSSASVLGDLAASLNDRTFVQMPEDQGLLGLKIDRSLLYWADSGEWDPINHRLIWLGGPGTCCANPAIYKVITYTEATDTWKVTNTPYQGSGHAYDGNAFNLNTGEFYFGKFGDSKVKVLKGSSWSTLPDLPFKGGTTPSLSWFPELNNGKGGLVYLGSGGNLAWYNGSTWSAIQYNSELQSYNGFMQYSALHKVVWFGAGNGSDRIHYKIDAQLNVTKYKNAPISLNNSKALHSVDPVGGNFIAANLENDTWWEFDPAVDNWTQISGIQGPNPLKQSGHFFIVPVPEHGVNIIFNHYWEYRRIYIYRHNSGNTVEEPAPVLSTSGPEITVSPNPFRNHVNINLTGYPENTIKIFNINGCCITTLSGSCTWNAADHPAGIYVIRAMIDNQTLSKRIFLTQ